MLDAFYEFFFALSEYGFFEDFDFFEFFNSSGILQLPFYALLGIIFISFVFLIIRWIRGLDMYEFMASTFIPSLKMVFEWIKEMFVSFSDKMQEGNTVSVVFMFSVLGTVISGLFYLLMNFIEHSINTDYSEPLAPLGTHFRGDSKTHNFRHAHYKSVNGKRFYYDTSSGNVSYFDEDSYQVMFDSDNPFLLKVHGKTIHDLPLNHKRFKKKFGNSSHYVINTDSGFYLVPKGNSRQARRYRRRISKSVGLDLNDNDFT